MRDNLKEQPLLINTYSFKSVSIVLSKNFIIACDEKREIRVWKKLDGELHTSFCIYKGIDINTIKCGTNDTLIVEYNTFAPKPSMLTYQVSIKKYI